MEKRWFLLLVLLLIPILSAQIPQVDISSTLSSNSNLDSNGIPAVVIEIPAPPTNYSGVNVNNSDFLNGYTSDEFWKAYETQTGLSGDKSSNGSAVFGSGTAREISLAKAGLGTYGLQTSANVQILGLFKDDVGGKSFSTFTKQAWDIYGTPVMSYGNRTLYGNWSISETLICLENGTNCLDNSNSSWNQSLANTLYYLITNPSGYYNSTTLPVSSMNYTNIAMTNQTNDFNGFNLNNVSVLGLKSSSVVSNAGNFNGSAYIIGGYSGIPINNNPFSFSIWIKANSTTSQIGFLGWGKLGNHYVNGFIYQHTLQITNGIDTNYFGTTTLDDGNWHNIVFIWNGTKGSAYIDNVSETLTGAFTTMTSEGVSYMSVGTFENGLNNFTGQIDEVQIFNKTLNSTEVANIYNSSLGSCGSVSDGLVVGYHLDGSFDDYSGNGNTGTNNGVTFVSSTKAVCSATPSIVNITYNSGLLCDGVACFSSSGSMNYTNLALTNQSNIFNGNQTINGKINITRGGGSFFNDATGLFYFDETGIGTNSEHVQITKAGSKMLSFGTDGDGANGAMISAPDNMLIQTENNGHSGNIKLYPNGNLIFGNSMTFPTSIGSTGYPLISDGTNIIWGSGAVPVVAGSSGDVQINNGAGNLGSVTGTGTTYSDVNGGSISFSNGVATSVSNPSDEKYKTKVNITTKSLLGLTPICWIWNNKYYSDFNITQKGNKTFCGFSAQDVQKVYPEMVKNITQIVYIGKDTTGKSSYKNISYLTVDYTQVTPMIYNELNKQRSEIDLLKSELCLKDKSYSWCK